MLCSQATWCAKPWAWIECTASHTCTEIFDLLGASILKLVYIPQLNVTMKHKGELGCIGSRFVCDSVHMCYDTMNPVAAKMAMK